MRSKIEVYLMHCLSIYRKRFWVQFVLNSPVYFGRVRTILKHKGCKVFWTRFYAYFGQIQKMISTIKLIGPIEGRCISYYMPILSFIYFFLQLTNQTEFAMPWLCYNVLPLIQKPGQHFFLRIFHSTFIRFCILWAKLDLLNTYDWLAWVLLVSVAN